MQDENKQEGQEFQGPIDDLDGDILLPDDSNETIEQTTSEQKESSPWDSEEVVDDEYSGKDSETKKELYTLSIPNEELRKDGAPNPMYRKLCLDKTGTIPPSDLIDCVVLKRIRPNIENVPYQEAQDLEAWEKTLGYSKDGIIPTPNKNREYMPSCIDIRTGKPYAICSLPTTYEKNKPAQVPLEQEERIITQKDFPYLPKGAKIVTHGECPRARWGNSMTDKDRKKYGIVSAKSKPSCDQHIIMYCWHLLQKVLFVAYFKRSSLKGADAFLAQFKRRSGPVTKDEPLYRYVSQISVERIGTYAIPVIKRTEQEASYADIKPVVDWFKENEERFVRNLSVTLQELREKADDQVSFDKPNKE